MNNYQKGFGDNLGFLLFPVVVVGALVVGGVAAEKFGYKQTDREQYLSKDEKMAIQMYKQGCQFKGYTAPNSSSTTGVGVTLNGKAGLMTGSTETKEQYHYQCQNDINYVVNFSLEEIIKENDLLQYVNKS